MTQATRPDNPVAPPRTDPTVIQMAKPLIVSFWMRAVVTFIDTVFAARLGDDAVAAIGLVAPFEFLMIAVWVGTSTGLTSVLSRALGARQARRMEQYKAIGWRMILTISPLFGAVGVSIWFIASGMSQDAGVVRNLQIYGTVLIAGSALTTFWSILPDSIVKAHQDTRSTMWAGIWSNVINVVLNFVFLFVFEWGIFGIALSTVIGRVGGLVYAIVQANRHERQRLAEADHVECSPDPHPYRGILGLAIPSSMTFVLMSLELALINMLLAAQPNPTESLAAYSIYYRVVIFALQPIIATSVAMLPFAARRFGQGDVSGMRSGLGDAVRLSTVYSLLIVAPILFFGAPWIARVLSESAITAEYATFSLRLVPFACFSGAVFLLCRPVFEAMNRGQPGLVMAAFRYVVLTAPLAWFGMLTATGQGQPAIYGLVIGLLIAAGVSSVVFYAWLRRALPGVGKNPVAA